MDELRLYSVSDEYIAYLKNIDAHIYSNKEEHRTHTRKYVGTVLEINSFQYFVPMSSPKKVDFQKAGDTMAIKKSIIPVYRMVIRDDTGNKKLLGTLRISHMIPVPETELELYDVSSEPDRAYRDLVNAEIITLRRNTEKIKRNAEIMYRQKIHDDRTAGYVDSALDYVQLEAACKAYEKLKSL